MRTPSIETITKAMSVCLFVAASAGSALGASFTIGGKVTGLKTGDSVTLLDGKASLKVTANGTFAFAAAVSSGTTYDITIGKQPIGETCTVANASGKVAASDIKNVDVTCGHTIGGTATGLKGGDSVVLEDDGGNLLTVTAPGKSASATVKFTFTTAVLVGDKYDVTIKTQPKGQTCIVLKPSGTVGTSNITTVEVACGYTIGGAVAGLKTGDSVTLEDKSGDVLKLTGNVKFVFKTPTASGLTYSVKVLTEPKGETCFIAHASGTVASANVTDITVNCAVPTFSISGAVSGLSSTATSITLKNGSATKTVTFPSTSFSFTGIPSGSAYAVTVVTPPTGETCTVSSNGSGSSITANITGVTVTCTAQTFSITGAVSGLSSTANSITLKNGSATKTVTFPGTSFSFTGIPSGSAYAVTVVTPPTGETCTVSSNGSGSSITANITGVAVTCAVQTFSISGSISWPSSGVNSSDYIMLQNGSATQTVVYPNTSFIFTGIPSGSAYDVTIVQPPSDENCSVSSNGSGSSITANITGVTVTCMAETYSISGAVSGLSSTANSITLKNGTATQTVTFPGTSFSFTGIPSGSAYAVTVVTPPTGETCTVSSNGSGSSITSNITGVAVTCTTSGGGGGGSGSFWIPYVVKPLPDLPMDQSGSTGLFIIPSDKITTSPMPNFVTMTSAAVQAIGIQYAFSTGNLISLTPQLMMYTAEDEGGNTHIYGLDLSNTSAVPTPVQISNLSLSPTQSICDNVATQVQSDLTDPTTMFLILDVNTTTSCGTGDTFEIVHYKDSPTTAPVVVSIPSDSVDTLYQDNLLTGMVQLDSNTGDVNLYADDTFSSPKVLFTGALYTQNITSTSKINSNDTGSSSLFYDVTTAATKDNPSGSTLYLITPSGSFTQIHQGEIGSNVEDDKNLYFVDITSTTSSVIYQVAQTGGTPLQLFSGPATTGTGPTLQDLYYDLIGTNDSILIYSVQTGIVTGAGPTTLYSLPIGTSSASATTIGSAFPAGVNVSAFLGTPTGGTPSQDVLFVTTDTETTGKSGTTYAYASTAWPAGGPYSASFLANSEYQSLGILSTQYQGSAWRVKGITDTDGGYGGGKAYVTDIGTLTDTVMTTTGGADYTFATGFTGELFSLSTNSVGVGVLDNESAVIASGETIPLQFDGAAADLSADFLYTLSLTNSEITPF